MQHDLFLRSEVARRLGVSVSTLALWERLGHIRPQRTVSGVRLYSREDIECLEERARLATDAVNHKATEPPEAA